VEQSLTSQTAPAHPGWIDMEDVINRSIEEVLYGRAEPKQSLQAAAEKIEDVVKRFE
jgi:maltose-binding protein MalE